MDIVSIQGIESAAIIVMEGDKGRLEVVSGRDTLKGEKSERLLPFKEKWNLSISSQYGCGIGCEHCDAALVGRGDNATLCDLVSQTITALCTQSKVESTNNLCLSFDRMGEPTFNHNVLRATYYLCGMFDGRRWGFTPEVCTMMPKENKNLIDFIAEWMFIKNVIKQGRARLRISINSTSESERLRIFNGKALTINEISDIFKNVPVTGEKIVLNFVLGDYTVDADKLVHFLPPDKFMCQVMRMNATEQMGKLKSHASDEKVTKVVEDLAAKGYEVLRKYTTVAENSACMGEGYITLLSGNRKKEEALGK